MDVAMSGSWQGGYSSFSILLLLSSSGVFRPEFGGVSSKSCGVGERGCDEGDGGRGVKWSGGVFSLSDGRRDVLD